MFKDEIEKKINLKKYLKKITNSTRVSLQNQ
jgi:hypothetical protein